jgi:poly(hydroxyalkanoate) granule-associated protein
MGKKLKELAGDVNENQLASTVKESAQQIWLAGLGAFAKAQEEGGKVFDALVKEGESIQSKTRKMTDEKIARWPARQRGTWDRLEQVFEDRVARALGSLGVPSKQDIDRLSKRVVESERRGAGADRRESCSQGRRQAGRERGGHHG